ncbi:MAG: hypothetical protein AB8B60_17415 [Sulfitobacter sp.]
MSLKTVLRDFLTPPATPPSAMELADMGLSLADYRRLNASDPGARGRMEHLAARFNVTPRMIDADHGLAVELALNCGHCGAKKACQRAIATGEDFDSARCPNSATYADMSGADSA